jgi:small subunit ribosomal protein S8
MVSDMASRVRNALQVQQPSVKVHNTHMTHSIAQILLAEGFIQSISSDGRFLSLELAYTGGTGCLTHITVISKPGVRIYSRAKDVPRILGGLGIMILSTSQGVITDKRARALGIGGELLCSIW